ncbi:MAG: FAD-dependent monooxygenase, partial [Pleurocapsa sp.]
ISTKVCIGVASLAGLLIANILKKNRIPCIVIEQNSYSALSTRSLVGLVDNKTVNILREYGLSDRLFQEGIPQSKCEFRTPEQSFILDYARKCQGQVRYTYPQQELFVDLVKKFEHTGGEILFATQVVNITNNNHGAWLKCKQNNQTIAVNCDFIAGCDGFDGISRVSIPDTITQPRIIKFNYAWLTITVEALSSSEHTIYGLHSNGFAGHILQQEDISRYYLQIPVEDTVADWSDDRNWSDLQLSMAKDDWIIKKGNIVTKKVLKLKRVTAQTMQHCRLFLAGDSAHMITSAEEKSMNLEIQDAKVLVQSFVSYYRYHDNAPLKNYSANRLPEIRQAQQFSESLLHMINIQDDHTSAGKSQQRVQKFKRSQLMNSEIYALDFARKYVGYVKSDRSTVKLTMPKKSANFVDFNPAELPPLKVG